MDKQQLAQHLAALATQEIPDDMNKWPEIRAQIESPTLRRPLRLSGYAAASLTLVVLLMTSLVAYAVYQWSDGEDRLDPGIDGVRDAGLVQPLDVSQTHDGVTIALTEGYADPNRIVLWATITTPDDMPVEYLNSLSWMLDTADGEFLNASMGFSLLGPTEDTPPNVHYGVLDFGLVEPLEVDQIGLMVTARLGGSQVMMIPPDVTPPPGPIPPEYMVDVPAYDPFELIFDLDVQPALTLEPNVTVESNDLSISLAQIVMAPSQTTFRLCYDLPDGRDWQVHFVEVSFDDEPSLPIGFGLVDPKPTGQETNRCVDYIYSMAAVEIPAKLTIKIDRLQTSLPEGMVGVDFDRALERLAAQGIVVKFSDPGQSFSWEIIEKPAELEDWQVGMLIWDSLPEWVEGAWVFEIPLTQ